MGVRYFGILSDHIHASDKLTHLALLFTAMLRHCTSLDGMLLGPGVGDYGPSTKRQLGKPV